MALGLKWFISSVKHNNLQPVNGVHWNSPSLWTIFLTNYPWNLTQLMSGFINTCTQAGFWSRTLEASWIEVWNLPNLLSTLLKLSKRFVSISSGQSDSCILSPSDQSVFTMEPSLFKAYLYLCAASVSLFCLWIFILLSEYVWNINQRSKVN